MPTSITMYKRFISLIILIYYLLEDHVQGTSTFMWSLFLVKHLGLSSIWYRVVVKNIQQQQKTHVAMKLDYVLKRRQHFWFNNKHDWSIGKGKRPRKSPLISCNNFYISFINFQTWNENVHNPQLLTTQDNS